MNPFEYTVEYETTEGKCQPVVVISGDRIRLAHAGDFGLFLHLLSRQGWVRCN